MILSGPVPWSYIKEIDIFFLSNHNLTGKIFVDVFFACLSAFVQLLLTSFNSVEHEHYSICNLKKQREIIFTLAFHRSINHRALDVKAHPDEAIVPLVRRLWNKKQGNEVGGPSQDKWLVLLETKGPSLWAPSIDLQYPGAERQGPSRHDQACLHLVWLHGPSDGFRIMELKELTPTGSIWG